MSQTDETGTTHGPIDIDPRTLQQWLSENQCVLVDVREDAERNEEHIGGSVPMPLSRFDAQALRDKHPGKRLVFHCKGGKRSAKACSIYANEEPVEHLAGGIDAWKSAGLPTVKPEGGPPIPLMRQVLLVAGLLILLGLGLGFAISPWFFALTGFVGFGLTFAGASGWCGMSMLLARMPWNKA